MRRRLLPLVFVCLAPAAAQQLATLYGRVLDPSDAGIQNASVAIVNEDTGFRRMLESDSEGSYSAGSLQPGSYKVTVTKEGFRRVIRFGVALSAGFATRADFSLPVGSMMESITVHGTAPLLDSEDATLAVDFDREQMQRIPINGGGLLGLLDIVPGTVVTPATRGEAGQFSTNGQRANTNYFTVDGVSANNGVTAGGLPAQSTGGTLPAVSAFGSLDSLISTSAVQDMRVQTSSSIAEFGRLPGASVELVSQSGSNEFRGATSYRFRNELGSANNWFGNEARFGRLPLRLNDLTQTFGGPVRRNRAFFFLSYEFIDLVQPFVWTQSVPGVAIRQVAADWAQPVLALFPLSDRTPTSGGYGLWTGGTSRPAGLNAGSVRFDRALTNRLTLFGRYNDAPSANQFGSIDVDHIELGARSLTLGADARPAADLVFDTRVNESESTAHSVWTAPGAGAANCDLLPLAIVFVGGSAKCDTLVRFTIAGSGQLISGREGDRWQRQFQAVQTANWRHRGHSFGFGADYRLITGVRRDVAGTLGVIADQLSDLLSSSKVWQSSSAPISQTARVQELSLWLQDTWQISHRLTLAMGLRWEYSPAPVPPIAVNFFNADVLGLVPARQPLWPTSDTDLAPRLGLAWRLDKAGGTVLRAGGGLYYDSSMSIASDFLNGGPLGVAQFNSDRNGIFRSVLDFAFMPNLRLPRVTEWNASLERAVTEHDLVSLAYAGAEGHLLIRREIGGNGYSATSWPVLTTNEGSSNYHSLQAQYRRRLAAGLEAQFSYTWAHSIDNGSSDAYLFWAGSGMNARSDRGSSDFDLRHTFNASASYEFHGPLHGWTVAGVLRQRAGFPVNVQQSEEYTGIALSDAFRPDLVFTQPVWIGDPNVPGGRRINPAAFSARPPAVEGNLGRNAIAGFGMWQLDTALTREFRWKDRKSLQIRLESFNLFNHPNFADPVSFMDNPLFGQAPSMLNLMLGTGSPGSGLSPVLQSGGPREFQGAVRFRF
ncbi:MAG TPA: TonB-dependent receptor [Candidatus Limnocylindrales bacterium]|nr:TonB-dependent receptor [Candidatus Limnocylindrales bacterium]